MHAVVDSYALLDFIRTNTWKSVDSQSQWIKNIQMCCVYHSFNNNDLIVFDLSDCAEIFYIDIDNLTFDVGIWDKPCSIKELNADCYFLAQNSIILDIS